MNIGTAVDNVLHALYRKQELDYDMSVLAEAYQNRQVNISSIEWSLEYWDLLNSVREYLQYPSRCHAEIMKKARLRAYPNMTSHIHHRFRGYVV